MVVTAISDESISSIILPTKIKGHYWLCASSDQTDDKLLSIEAFEGDWQIKPIQNGKLTDENGRSLNSCLLEPAMLIMLTDPNGKKYSIYAEPLTKDRQIFTKYFVKDHTELMIGRGKNCDICYTNTLVSSDHAQLTFGADGWSIRDLNSTNGTFVNGKKVSDTRLRIGDVVFIMGLKIVIGKSFAAFNDPDGAVSITNKLTRFVAQKADPINYDQTYELAEAEYFYRSPRFKRDIETEKITIDSPPQNQMGEDIPWFLVMGSTLTMGVMSAVTFVSAIVSANISSVIMGGSMLLGSALLPNLTKKYEKKRRGQKEQLRQKKYREYLDSVIVKINDTIAMQEEILRENHATIEDCETRILEVRRNLWDRSPEQNDFLNIRIGTGEADMNTEFSYSQRKFSLSEDVLEEEMLSICEQPHQLKNVPITYSLLDHHISGVIGYKDQLFEFVKGVIIQLSALYSYDEVKLIFICDKEDEKHFRFVKWLPHIWSNDKAFRYIATDMNELKEIGAELEETLNKRIAAADTSMDEEQPYYVIFSMSHRLAARSDIIKQILSQKKKLNFSIVSCFEKIERLPKECSMVVNLDEDSCLLFDKNDISGKSTEFVPDIFPHHDPVWLSTQLSNISLDSESANFALPDSVTFLEMFGAGKVEHLNILARWKENDPTKSLAAAVGYDTFGDLFYIDLHEKFHGPHGLIAGMTGSGKSEFIITYILSLAVNYHPDEVAFILIDYKGGGMANSFEKLPHTAGIITNLDGAAIKRSLVSIESELKRRQKIFAEVSKVIGESNINIYMYQKLYREGAVSEPMPHLFIISDEFAELKTQQPEFMTQLISAARIGRSLGIHLILATQKPSGVVDDQIWSNSRFKVCLKVQERADSMDMLKRPDAAELNKTGRFYLQVGYNELFELGQSAWAGAPYYPMDKPYSKRNDIVSVIDTNGHIIKQMKSDAGREFLVDSGKQVDVITDYLCTIAKEEKIETRQLWLEPIPPVILINELKIKYSAANRRFVLEPIIGEYDDPANQSQHLLRLPLSQEGNAIIFGMAGGGKTSFLNAVIYSLLTEHTPEEVNIYLLDFASETLKAFEKAPHVGDVILSYEDEKLTNLFKMLGKELALRKKLFSAYGGDYASFIASSGQSVPSEVIVINGFASFNELHEDKLGELSVLIRDGSKYGIYFILTAFTTSGISFRLMQNFKEQITLQLSDESDYSMIMGKTEGLYPAKFKGRGLVKLDGLYEFQTAMIVRDDSPYSYIREFCRRLDSEYNGVRAKRIPLLPDKVDMDYLASYFNAGKPLCIPVGVEKNSLNVHYYDMGRSYLNMILSASQESASLTSELAELIAYNTNLEGYIFDTAHLMNGSTGRLKYCNNFKSMEEMIDELFELVLYRNNTYKDALEAGETPEEFEQRVVIFTSLSSPLDSLSGEKLEKLSLILERGTAEYKITIIAADKAKAISSHSYDAWYKAHITESDGIWVGGGFSDQYQLKSNNNLPEMRQPLSRDYGFAIRGGKCVAVKLLNMYSKEDNDG